MSVGSASTPAEEAEKLRARIEELERENARLRAGVFVPSSDPIVRVARELQPPFDRMAKTMGEVFQRIDIDPSRAMIAIDGERYLLVRASAFSIDFLDTLVQFYADR